MDNEEFYLSYDIDESVMRSIERQDTLSKIEYHSQIAKHKNTAAKFPRLRHKFWWLLHNCIAHSLIGILPTDTFFRFHDWTSNKMNIN